MKRFDLNDTIFCGEPWREMEESEDGDWVRASDVEAIIAERDAWKKWAMLMESCSRVCAVCEHRVERTGDGGRYCDNVCDDGHKRWKRDPMAAPALSAAPLEVPRG